MPTGYTHQIANGEVTTLRQFAMSAARGMGALVTMRDEPHDAPVPDWFEPSSYHSERIAEAHQRLAAALALSDKACVEKAKDLYAAQRASLTEARERDAEVRNRYERMLDQVKAWKSAPEGLREFMTQQLTESIRFDCMGDSYRTLPAQLSGDVWREQEVEGAKRDIDYHRAELTKEVERTASRNAWLAQLRAGLDQFEAEQA